MDLQLNYTLKYFLESVWGADPTAAEVTTHPSNLQNKSNYVLRARFTNSYHLQKQFWPPKDFAKWHLHFQHGTLSLCEWSHLNERLCIYQRKTSKIYINEWQDKKGNGLVLKDQRRVSNGLKAPLENLFGKPTQMCRIQVQISWLLSDTVKGLCSLGEYVIYYTKSWAHWLKCFFLCVNLVLAVFVTDGDKVLDCAVRAAESCYNTAAHTCSTWWTRFLSTWFMNKRQKWRRLRDKWVNWSR